GKVVHILINNLDKDFFYARIVLDMQGHRLEIDSRPSDAIALAVRVRVPVYVEDVVMEKAAITPDQEVEGDQPASEGSAPSDERLSVFKDFVDTLDLDDLDDHEQ